MRIAGSSSPRRAVGPALGLLLLALGAVDPSLGIPRAAASEAATLVVRADRLHTGTGAVIADAVVVIEGGVIARVGSATGPEAIPTPSDVPVRRTRIATPGFIDTHTSAGLSGLRNVAAVRDQDESTDPDQSALRAIDAFDPRDPLLRYLLELGVTLVQTGPGPANPIAGQAGIFRTHGTSADEMAVRFPSAMVFNLGDTPKHTYSEKGPSTRMGTAALIRGRLLAARAYRGARRGLFGRPSKPDLGLAALAPVARGELPAIVLAHRADDVLTALRIGRELDLDLVIAGGTEAYLVRDHVKAARVPVLVGPVMERISTPETENATYENAAFLADVGVPIALRTGYEGYVPKNRVLLFEAALAAANGLGRERALRSITLGAAELLKISKDYGSIERGKVADLVLFDGDPFEYTSHVTGVVAAGELVYAREAQPPRH